MSDLETKGGKRCVWGGWRLVGGQEADAPSTGGPCVVARSGSPVARWRPLGARAGKAKRPSDHARGLAGLQTSTWLWTGRAAAPCFFLGISVICASLWFGLTVAKGGRGGGENGFCHLSKTDKEEKVGVRCARWTLRGPGVRRLAQGVGPGTPRNPRWPLGAWLLWWGCERAFRWGFSCAAGR